MTGNQGVLFIEQLFVELLLNPMPELWVGYIGHKIHLPIPVFRNYEFLRRGLWSELLNWWLISHHSIAIIVLSSIVLRRVVLVVLVPKVLLLLLVWVLIRIVLLEVVLLRLIGLVIRPVLIEAIISTIIRFHPVIMTVFLLSVVCILPHVRVVISTRHKIVILSVGLHYLFSVAVRGFLYIHPLGVGPGIVYLQGIHSVQATWVITLWVLLDWGWLVLENGGFFVVYHVDFGDIVGGYWLFNLFVLSGKMLGSFHQIVIEMGSTCWASERLLAIPLLVKYLLRVVTRISWLLFYPIISLSFLPFDLNIFSVIIIIYINFNRIFVLPWQHHFSCFHILFWYPLSRFPQLLHSICIAERVQRIFWRSWRWGHIANHKSSAKSNERIFKNHSQFWTSKRSVTFSLI